jgi:CDP-diacylglycerol--serine O-phosphatidyltransferase
LVPSGLTILNLACGWAAIVHAMQGNFAGAAPFIALAILFDMLDGRIARMTGTTSAFGAQLDSLADLVSFGLAPALLVYQWGLQPLGALGWMAGFAFVAAAAVRLARFNAHPCTDGRYFTGLPSPAAAALIAATVLMFSGGLHTPRGALLGLVIVTVPAVLMVSTLRFRSFKTVDVHALRTYQLLSVAVIVAALAIMQPHEVFLVAAYAYLTSAFVELAV